MEIAQKIEQQVLKLRLKGVIDERLNLSNVLNETVPTKIHIYLEGVERINSIGSKKFMIFLNNCKKKNIEVTLFNCSTAVVDVLNLLASYFSDSCNVHSVCVPFQCEKCFSESHDYMSIEELKKIRCKVPNRACSNCDGSSVFSDTHQEYFLFINYSFHNWIGK